MANAPRKTTPTMPKGDKVPFNYALSEAVRANLNKKSSVKKYETSSHW